MRPRERRLATATTWFFSFYSVESNLRRDDKFQWRVMWKEEEEVEMNMGRFRLMYILYIFPAECKKANSESTWFGGTSQFPRLDGGCFRCCCFFGWVPLLRYKDRPPRVGVGNFFLFSWMV